MTAGLAAQAVTSGPEQGLAIPRAAVLGVSSEHFASSKRARTRAAGDGASGGGVARGTGRASSMPGSVELYAGQGKRSALWLFPAKRHVKLRRRLRHLLSPVAPAWPPRPDLPAHPPRS